MSSRHQGRGGLTKPAVVEFISACCHGPDFPLQTHHRRWPAQAHAARRPHGPWITLSDPLFYKQETKAEREVTQQLRWGEASNPGLTHSPGPTACGAVSTSGPDTRQPVRRRESQLLGPWRLWEDSLTEADVPEGVEILPRGLGEGPRDLRQGA